MDWHLIISFTLIAVVLVVLPGPNFALIAKSISSGGQPAALANIPGFAAAYLMHGILSIFGVAALLEALPDLLIFMQLVGALYLLYLGVQSFSTLESSLVAVENASGTGELAYCAGSGAQPQMGSLQSVSKGIADGFFINSLNPKISLFYYAVFPQLTAGSDNVVLTSFLLIVIHIVINVLWFSMIAIALGRMLQSASSESFLQVLRKGSGVILIGFSVFFAAGVAQAI